MTLGGTGKNKQINKHLEEDGPGPEGRKHERSCSVLFESLGEQPGRRVAGAGEGMESSSLWGWKQRHPHQRGTFPQKGALWSWVWNEMPGRESHSASFGAGRSCGRSCGRSRE